MRCLVASLLSATALVAAEPAPPAPPEASIVSEQVPDVARLRDRLAHGPLGRIWALPELAPLKQRLDERFTAFGGRTGLDAWALINDLDSARLEVVATPTSGQPSPGGRPGVTTRFAISFASQADAVWALLVKVGQGGGGAAPDQPVTLGRLTWAHDAGTLLAADGGAPRALAAPAGAPADADIFARVDFAALWRALASPGGEAAVKELGLSTLDYATTLGVDGASEVAKLPGAKLPLLNLDTATLAALPADAILVAAIAVDGARLDEQLVAIAKASQKLARRIADAETACADAGLGDPHALLRGWKGTVALVVTSGTPFPGVTIMLPASPELDRLLDTISTKNGLPLGPARGQALALPFTARVPVTAQVRRTATHWVVSSDAPLLERLGADHPPGDGFDAKARIAAALGAPGDASLLLWQDNRAVARLAQAGIALAGARRGGQDADRAEILQEVGRALGAAGPLLEPTVAALAVDDRGATLRSRNLAMQTLTVGVVAGVAMPALAQARAGARRARSGANARQLALHGVAYASTHGGAWPATLEEFATSAGGDLPDEVFSSPSAPEVAGAYLYVRPAVGAPATQPVIVEDPACNRGRGSMVAYGDGHVAFARGTSAWDQARRLAQLPEAKAAGIAAERWAPFERPNGAAPAPPEPAPPGKAEF